MNKLVRSDKGASSILVILLLVVLIVFGVAALTTALANARLGQKVQDWNSKYYSAEAEANEIYAEIDAAISQSLPLSSGDPVLNITRSVDALDEDIKMTQYDTHVDFAYEVWKQDIGLHVILSFDLETMLLSTVEWKEIQQETSTDQTI